MQVMLSEISALLSGSYLVGDDVEVIGVSHDSRRIGRGFLFAAMRGTLLNGINFVNDALTRGAVAVLVSERYLDSSYIPDEIPKIVVPSVRQALGETSALIYGRPSQKLNLIGITGTNGKTTTSFLLDAALSQIGMRTGIIGTIEFRSANKREPSTFTTPEAPDLQAMLSEMAENGVDAVSMEVSSHGLDQRRVDSSHFRIGIFTNLTAEHLDYHGTIEQYYFAKAQLFEPSRCDFAIISIDDPWGERLASQLAIPHVTYGTREDADYVVGDIKVSHHGTCFSIRHQDKYFALSTQIVGGLNALNATAAFIAATELGGEPTQVKLGIEGCTSVAGRFQLIEAGQPSMVVVDYAHTPDAISQLVKTVRSLIGDTGRVLVVGGARGGRDRLKRPALGRALAEADLVILTTDNPGDEDPHDIISELLLGTLDVASRHIHIEISRSAAIEFALRNASSSDAVIIVGRGHETSIRVGRNQIHLDDREVVRLAAQQIFGIQNAQEVQELAR